MSAQKGGRENMAAAVAVKGGREGKVTHPTVWIK